MKNKYHNRRTQIGEISFDSVAEARRFNELKMMLEIGEIRDLELQPRFELQPSFKKRNRTVRKIEYIADFMYKDRKGNTIVEDVKGMETDVFRLKQKLFEYKYPNLTLTLIKRGKKK